MDLDVGEFNLYVVSGDTLEGAEKDAEALSMRLSDRDQCMIG